MKKLSYTKFKELYGDLGITNWIKYNWMNVQFEPLSQPKYFLVLNTTTLETNMKTLLNETYQLGQPQGGKYLSTYLKDNYPDKWLTSGSGTSAKVLKDSVFPNSAIVQSSRDVTVDYSGFDTREEAAALYARVPSASKSKINIVKVE